MATHRFFAVAAAVVLLAACADGGGSVGTAGSDIADPGSIAPPDGASGEGDADVSEPEPDTTGGTGDAGCPDGAACDDGDPCTSGDQCNKGLCVGLAYACDDERPCTADSCDGLGGCTFAIADDACLIGNACFASGDQQGCAACLPEVSKTAWSAVGGDDEPCDDGDACTGGDHCVGASCEGGAVDCDDDNSCTDDACDPATGCTHAPALGLCDDGSACTDGDQCDGGLCVGMVPKNCNDDNACTDDSCDETSGCANTPREGGCTDGDACSLGDTCQEGACVAGPPNPCDDDNDCTTDSCDAGLGCVHAPLDGVCCTAGEPVCGDGDPCTIDLCDAETGACGHEPNLGPCNDGNPCTSGDTCQGGVCTGASKDCDDGNPCTEDSCEGFGTCVHAPTSGAPCDDGKECSTGDTCTAGVCLGDASACVCQPAFADAVSKVNALAIGTNGKAGQGLDVDGDPATCSPAGQCEAGIDNTLSAVASFANNSLGDAVKKGSVMLLLEHAGLATDGTSYTLSFYTGDLAQEGCDFQTQSCAYTVSAGAFDEDCGPLIGFDGAKIVDGVLTAGGPDTEFPFSLPISGLDLTITIKKAKLKADVTVEGGLVVAMKGVIAGAVSKAELKAAISALPPEQFPSGFSKETILGFVDVLVVNDIDADGDGTMESASIGIPFEAIPGTITGVN